tara:strand:- start:7320 stop:7886 length:567 start_codon:yes stop_codon:yes gene_type:complete
MALIPLTYKLDWYDPSQPGGVISNTNNNVNKATSFDTQYSMQDVIDTVSAGGGGTDLKQTTVTLSAAQMLTLNGGGTLELLPAPGAGKLIAVMNVVYKLDFNSVAYDYAGALGQTIQFYIGTEPSRNILFGVLNAAIDEYGSLDFPNSDSNTNIEPNVAFTLQASGGITVSQGDSPFVLSILYREVAV